MTCRCRTSRANIGAQRHHPQTIPPTPSRRSAYDPGIMNLVEKVTAFKLQTRALDEAKAGNIAGATQKLRAAATRLLELGEADLAEAAQQEANNLEQSGQMSASGTKKLRYQTRKLTQKTARPVSSSKVKGERP